MDLTEEVFIGADAPEKLADVENLRIAAWRDLISLPFASERFGLEQTDRNAWHVCLRSSGSGEPGRLVACSRLSIHESVDTLPDPGSFLEVEDIMNFPLAVMSRLAVLPDCRGRGYAYRLDTLRIRLAAKFPVRQVWIEAREARVKSLQDRHFTVAGKSSDRSVPGMWFMMYLKLET